MRELSPSLFRLCRIHVEMEGIRGNELRGVGSQEIKIARGLISVEHIGMKTIQDQSMCCDTVKEQF